MISLTRSLKLQVRKVGGSMSSLAYFRMMSSRFGETGPSPPKLPKKDQEEFEALQKIANSHAAVDAYNRQVSDNSFSTDSPPAVSATDIGTFAQYLKAIPEFEGDVNPKTGEVGGPKQDPLKHNDWSYNGRVTDF